MEAEEGTLFINMRKLFDISFPCLMFLGQNQGVEIVEHRKIDLDPACSACTATFDRQNATVMRVSPPTSSHEARAVCQTWGRDTNG